MRLSFLSYSWKVTPSTSKSSVSQSDEVFVVQTVTKEYVENNSSLSTTLQRRKKKKKEKKTVTARILHPSHSPSFFLYFCFISSPYSIFLPQDLVLMSRKTNTPVPFLRLSEKNLPRERVEGAAGRSAERLRLARQGRSDGDRWRRWALGSHRL